MYNREAFDAWLDYPSLVKGGRVTGNWLPDGRFWFVDNASENATIRVFDRTTRAIEHVVDISAAAPDHFVSKDFKQANFFGNGFGFPVSEILSPDRRWFSSVHDDNIWLRSSIDGSRRQITFDGIARNAWNLDSSRKSLSGASIIMQPWSSDSLQLFASKLNTDGLKPFLLTRWNIRHDEIEEVYPPRAGGRLPRMEPYIINVTSGEVVCLNVETDERFLAFIGWREDNQALYFAQFSRDVHWGGVFEANPATGKTRLLFEEQGDTFIRIQHDVIAKFSGCTPLAQGQGFIWESTRDGWKHFYHYDPEGRLVRQLTHGDFPVVEMNAFDPTTKCIYFTAHHDPNRPYDVHLCRIPLSGGEIERLTEEHGVHAVQMAPDFTSFIDTVSRPDLPPQSTLRSTVGEILYRFPPADVTALVEVGWTPAEEFSVKAADGETDIWGVIYKPANFDPSQRYPIIECIYGGPQLAYVAHRFPLNDWYFTELNQALPQLGYVVVMLDGRGTPERSKSFQDVTYKDWRRHVTADHAAALRNLAKERPWMDLNRVGIWGFSWGGYFTFANLIDNPDLYRAGVAASPGFDAYNLSIYEPYHGGVPSSETKAAYDDSDLFRDAQKLVSQFMIVIGSNDVPHWQDAVHMTNALIEAGKDHEFVMLPGQFHGYAEKYNEYFIEKLVNFFDRTVKRVC